MKIETMSLVTRSVVIAVAFVVSNRVWTQEPLTTFDKVIITAGIIGFVLLFTGMWASFEVINNPQTLEIIPKR